MNLNNAYISLNFPNIHNSLQTAKIVSIPRAKTQQSLITSVGFSVSESLLGRGLLALLYAML